LCFLVHGVRLMGLAQTAPGEKLFLPFVWRRWWGLSCLTAFAVLLALAYYPHRTPSDEMRGFQSFLANPSDGAGFEILYPPRKMEVVVNGGPRIFIENGVPQSDPGQPPYRVQVDSGAIRISGLDPNVSPEDAGKIWKQGAVVIETGGDFRIYRLPHDVPLLAATGAYRVKGNRITEHHFIVQNTFFAILAVFLVIPLYLGGAAWRTIVRYVRGRRRPQLDV
jgi:hypothetical protein